jgi:NAD(P)-dependent dehydrogenase (short-subunit alcohol dehydrogenase family)
MSLDSQRVVMIGGTSGIGLATAKRAAAAGARPVVASRSAQRVEWAKAEIGGSVEGAVLDATDEGAVEAFFAGLGPFDHLAGFVPTATNEAIASRQGRFLDMTMAEFRALLDNRFWGCLNCIRHGAPHVSATGSITIITGVAHRKGQPGYTVSAVGNAALEGLMRVLALELAPVRVNAVAPGYIRTPVLDVLPKARTAHWERFTAAQPVARMGEADEVARAVLFMMESGFTTGAILEVDGGYKLT